MTRRIASFTLALLLAFPVLGATSTSEASACEPITLTRTPGYVLSGLWVGSEDRDQLVLVEPLRRSISWYDQGRRPVDKLPPVIASGLDKLKPYSATPLPDGGMVIELDGSHFQQLSPQLHSEGEVDIALQAGRAEVFPFRWELLGPSLREGGLLMCGDVGTRVGSQTGEPEIKWGKGLFYLPAGPEAPYGEVVQFADFALDDLNRLGCRLGGQLFAVVDGTPYVLLMEGLEAENRQQPQIYRMDVDRGELIPLSLDHRPEELDKSPALRTFQPMRQYAALMQDVEASAMPTELVAGEKSLYVVLRRPNLEQGPGTTTFSVARLDNLDSEEANLSVAEIDSVAHHVSLVAGPNYFALLEKQGAGKFGDQKVTGLRLIPTSRLQSFQHGEALCP